jgi:hypothetical protein
MSQERNTIGQIYLDTVEKEHEQYEAEEIRREVHKKYEKAILECIDQGKKSAQDHRSSYVSYSLL